MVPKVKGYKELLVRLKYFQSDYYTRGRALEVHQFLKANSEPLIFSDAISEIDFHHQLVRLKECESLTDIDSYADRFSHTLMRIVLIVHKDDYKR